MEIEKFLRAIINNEAPGPLLKEVNLMIKQARQAETLDDISLLSHRLN